MYCDSFCRKIKTTFLIFFIRNMIYIIMNWKTIMMSEEIQCLARENTFFFHANDVWLSVTQLWRHICYHIFLIYFLIYNVQWATDQSTNALVFVEQKSNSFVSVIPNQCIYSVTHWHLHQNKWDKACD